MYGHKEGGCKDNNCTKLHMSLCKIFMRHITCKYGKSCKYFYPKKLKVKNQRSNFTPSQTNQNENIIYAQIVKTPLQHQFQPQLQPQFQANEQSPFLGLPQYKQQPLIGQENQFQQKSNTQVFLDLQSGQKQMMQMFMNLNQKLMNLEKHNLQMQHMKLQVLGA